MNIDYDIQGVSSIRLDSQGIPVLLRQHLAPYEVAAVDSPFLELVLCRSPLSMPQLPPALQSGGYYKGIPWRIAFERDQEGSPGRVFFYAPVFMAFLAMRMVIIPYIKQCAIAGGGFSILGSVFRYENKTFMVFGHPGAGKTWMMLQALERGASLVADNELLVSADGEVRGLFDEIELRYRTLRGNRYWSRISFGQKLRLLLYRGISLGTLGRLSFNICPTPGDLGVEMMDDDPRAPHIVLQLSPQSRISQMLTDSMVDSVIEYEQWYRSVFGSFFASTGAGEDWQMRRNLKTFYHRCSLWRIPLSSDLGEVLALPDRMKA